MIPQPEMSLLDHRLESEMFIDPGLVQHYLLAIDQPHYYYIIITDIYIFTIAEDHLIRSSSCDVMWCVSFRFHWDSKSSSSMQEHSPPSFIAEYSNTVCDEPIHFSAIRWLCKKKRVPKNLHKLIIISGFHWVTHTKFSHVKWSLNTDLISLMRYICLWSIL